MSNETHKNEGSWRFWFACVFLIPVIDFFTLRALPYDFFQLLRILAFGGFSYLAYTYFVEEEADETGLYVFAALAALYNPFFRVEMSRELWTGANVISALIIYAADKNLIFAQRPVLGESNEAEIDRDKSLQLEMDKRDQYAINETSEKILKIADILTGLLAMQKMLIENTGRGSYLRSLGAKGFVYGFITGFISVSSKRTSLNNSERDWITQRVLKEIFDLNTNDLSDFTGVASTGSEFQAAKLRGSSSAVMYLDNPEDRKAQISWWLHASGDETELDKLQDENNAATDADMLDTIQDYVSRVYQVDDSALATLKLQCIKELIDLFEMSPDAESWFLELDPKHLDDLHNLQAATWLKIQVGQSNGEFADVASQLLILVIITGIIDNEVTEIAFELWQHIKDQTGQKFRAENRAQLKIISEQIDISGDQANYNLILGHVLTWEPEALIEKYLEKHH